MEKKLLYCHTDLVMTTGGICAFAGKSYEVIDESDYYYEIINADGEPHTFSKKTHGSNYRTWFSLEPVDIKNRKEYQIHIKAKDIDFSSKKINYYPTLGDIEVFVKFFLEENSSLTADRNGCLYTVSIKEVITLQDEFKFVLDSSIAGADNSVFTAKRLEDDSYLVSWNGAYKPVTYQSRTVLRYLEEGSWVTVEND